MCEINLSVTYASKMSNYIMWPFVEHFLKGLFVYVTFGYFVILFFIPEFIKCFGCLLTKIIPWGRIKNDLATTSIKATNLTWDDFLRVVCWPKGKKIHVVNIQLLSYLNIYGHTENIKLKSFKIHNLIAILQCAIYRYYLYNIYLTRTYNFIFLYK